MRLVAGLLVALAVGCEDSQTTSQPQDGSDPDVDGGIAPDVDGGIVGDATDAAVDAMPDAPANLTPCQEAVFHSDLTWIQQKIFNASCTASHCHHGGSEPKAGLALTADRSHAQLVNVQSTINTTWVRVSPGNPSASILLVRLGGATGPNAGTMPTNQPLLCQEKIDAVQRWIASGAPKN